MLTPQQLSTCADIIEDLYATLNESIVRDIARRIAKTGYITDTADWQARCLQESGMLFDDILHTVASYSGKADSAIAELFREAAITSMNYDNIIYNSVGLNIIVSDAVRQVLEAGYRKTGGEIANLTRTTATTVQQSFIDACTLAEMQVSSGAFSYQTAINQIIQKIASEGAYIIYPSGHRDRLEVAARRNILTGLGQTVGQISLMNAEELGCDLMEITAHSGARPSHAAWQGQIVSLSGDNSEYLSLSDIGYGTGDGFKGWNCRHDWFPYFEGISTRAYNDKDLARLNEKCIEYKGKMYTEYEAEQRQRYYERSIRETKRKLAALDETIRQSDIDALLQISQQEFNKLSIRLKQQEARLNDFCDTTGLLKRDARAQIFGFGRDTSRKATELANNHFKTWSKEHNIDNIKSLADYYRIKYNDTKRYEILKTYVKSIDKGTMSPNVSFSVYEEYHNRVQNELVGLTTSDGIVIQSQSKHFLERVFGTWHDPTHNDNKREGVSLEDIKDALLNGKSTPTHGGKSRRYTTPKCIVTVNPITGNLIQTNPK